MPVLAKQKLLNLVVVLIPLALVLIFFAWYNWSRFNSIFESGIKYHLMHVHFQSNYYRFGYFNLHYLRHNVYYSLLRLPIFEHQHLFREPDSPHDWKEGYSLFYQSPVFLYAFAVLRLIKKDCLISALWLSTVLTALPILFCMGSGWVQFGARYLFDLCPLLFPLVIIGTGGRITPVLILLVILSVIVNVDGMHYLGC